MKEIPLYNSFKIIKPIEKGFSNDEKYFVQTIEGEKYFLRISDVSDYETKKSEFERMKRIFENKVSIPRLIEFGKCENETKIYALFEWVEGTEVEDCLPKLSEEEQYFLGLKAGKILRTLHNSSEQKKLENWAHRYFLVLKPRIEAYKSEGDKFEGAKEILNYLEEKKHLLENRPQSEHHGDYHIGNMILSNEDELFIIDWHTIDFDNYGDPWYEFNRIDTNFSAFASGQIDGYFNHEVPLEFWKLFAYYISVSAITSIVWAKYYSPESLEEILKKNRDVLKWFDNMKNPIPCWYRKYRNGNFEKLNKGNKNEKTNRN